MNNCWECTVKWVQFKLASACFSRWRVDNVEISWLGPRRITLYMACVTRKVFTFFTLGVALQYSMPKLWALNWFYIFIILCQRVMIFQNGVRTTVYKSCELICRNLLLHACQLASVLCSLLYLRV